MTTDVIGFYLSSALLGAILIVSVCSELGFYSLASWLGRGIIRILTLNRIRIKPEVDDSAAIVIGAMTVIALFIVVIITFP